MYCMSVDVCTHARKTVSECVCVRSLCHTCSVCTVCDVLHNECTEGMHLFYTYRHLYACVRTCIRTWVHMLVCARVYVCTYMRTHAYILLINKYTHTVCVYRQTEKDRCTDRLTCCLAG